MLDQQACLAAMGRRQRPQSLVEFSQGADDEFHPAVGPREPVEDLAVEDEEAEHLPAVDQGLVQGLLVMGAQIAAQPDQAAFIGGSHGLIVGRAARMRRRYSTRQSALQGCSGPRDWPWLKIPSDP